MASKLTKIEVLSGHLEKERIYHTRKWKEQNQKGYTGGEKLYELVHFCHVNNN